MDTFWKRSKDDLAFAAGMRSSYNALIPSAGVGDSVAAVRDVLIPTQQGMRVIARIYHPNGDDRDIPAIVFAHGGGHVSGSLATHDVLARALAITTDAVVIAVDYHLAPEAQFPVPLLEIADVLTWVREHCTDLHVDPSRIALVGDSAGGTLVAATTIAQRDRSTPTVAAQLLLYPALSGARLTTASWQQYGHTMPSRNLVAAVLAAYVPAGISTDSPLIAPLNDPRGGADLPPLLVLVGERDPLRDEGVAYAELLSAHGVPAQSKVYSGAEHGFVQFFKDRRTHPQGARALADGCAFLRSILHPSAPIAGVE